MTIDPQTIEEDLRAAMHAGPPPVDGWPDPVTRVEDGITRRKRDGIILHSAADVKVGDTIITRLAEGEVISTVEDARQPKLFE